MGLDWTLCAPVVPKSHAFGALLVSFVSESRQIDR